MDFVIFVQVGEHLCGLADDGCDVLLCEPLLEHIEKVGGRAEAEFHRHPDVLSLHIAPVVLHSIGMLQRANKLNFLHDVTEFLRRERDRMSTGEKEK